MEQRCPFCERIENGLFDYLSPYSVSFEPLNPVTPGHRLVVPIEHVEDALSYPYLTGRVMEDAARLAKRDCNLITSVGPMATQTVKHLHIHIVPRRILDGLTLPWTGQKRD